MKLAIFISIITARHFSFRQLGAALVPLLIGSCGNASTNNAPITEDVEIDAAPSANAPSMTKAEPKMPIDPVSNVKMSRFKFPSCSELKAKDLSEGDLITHLDGHYPAELVSVETVENVELNSDDLTQLTGYVACVASLTPGPDAPESALALFASKRYGNAAMAALKKQANGSSVEAKAANDFAERIAAFLRGPVE
jgi:hypothetical protein